MKKLSLIILAFALCSCGGIMPVKPDQTVNPKKVIVIGKVSFEPKIKIDLSQAVVLGDAKYMEAFSAYFMKNENADYDDYKKGDYTIFQQWDEYFVWEMPREKLNFNHLSISIGGPRTLVIKFSIPMDYAPEDQFVYIGDLVFMFGVKNDMGGTDDILEVRDNSAEVKKLYGNYVKGADGKPAPLTVKLVKGGKVNVTLIKTIEMQY